MSSLVDEMAATQQALHAHIIATTDLSDTLADTPADRNTLNQARHEIVRATERLNMAQQLLTQGTTT